MSVYTCNERTSPIYTGTLTDSVGDAVPLAAISTLTLTLFDQQTGQILNSRDSQDVKNANNVTVAATSGLLTWQLQPADTAIIDGAKAVERHLALFTWTTATQTGRHVVNIDVTNLAKVA